MHLKQVSIEGDDFIGLFGLATDKYALLSRNFLQVKETLKVKEVRTSVYGTGLLGLFCAGNSHGLLLPYFMEGKENKLKKLLPKGVKVGIVSGKFTALGNLILSNDEGCVVSPKLKNEKKVVEDILDVELVIKKIGGHEEVGSCGVVTNKGFLIHPDAEEELKELEKIFKVPGNVGTVNFGFPYPKAGLIANSQGYLTGKHTSGIELGRIDEALGFL